MRGNRHLLLVIFLYLFFFPFFSIKARLNIFGQKTFEVKHVKIKGDLNQFINENPMEKPGFDFTQKLQLKINGYILKNVKVNAELDDTSREKKELTVFIDGKIWDITLGDFRETLGDTEYTIYNKKLKGVKLEGSFGDKYKITAFITRSEGRSDIKRFQGRGSQQEYKLPQNQLPIVKGSEVVYIDNKKLVRGTDYEIDYEEGIITFKPVVLPIESTSWITVEYEYDEAASAYKRNLLGLRAAVKFNKTNFLGITYATDYDDRSSPIVEVDEDSPSPKRHHIFDINGRFKLGDFIDINGEFAHSRFDINTDSSDDELIKGNAHKISTKLKYADTELNIKHQRIDPTFNTIGKKKLTLFRETVNVQNDLDKLNVSLKSRLFKNKINIYSSYDRSLTNIMNVANKNTSKYHSLNNVVQFNYLASGKISLRKRLDKRRTENTTVDQKRDTQSIEISQRLFRLQTDFKYEIDDNDYLKTRVQDEKRVTREIRLTSIPDRKAQEGIWKWLSKINVNTSYQNISVLKNITEDPYQNITNLSLSITANPIRAINASGVVVNRHERNLTGDFSVKNSLTADMRLRLEPFRGFRNDFKYKEIHVKRYVKEEGQDRTIEAPVVTRDGSFSMNFYPVRYINTNLRIYHRDVYDADTGRKYNNSDRTTLRIKLAPDRTISSIFQYRINHNVTNQTTKSNTYERSKFIEIRKAFKREFTLTSKYEVRDRKDKVKKEESVFERKGSVKLDKRIGYSATTYVKYTLSSIDKLLENYLKDTGEIGLTLSNLKNRLKTRVNYILDRIRKNVTSFKHTGEIKFDYRLNDSTNVFAELKLIDSDPVDNGKGYKAAIGNAKVEVRF